MNSQAAQNTADVKNGATLLFIWLTSGERKHFETCLCVRK